MRIQLLPAARRYLRTEVVVLVFGIFLWEGVHAAAAGRSYASTYHC